MFKFDFIRMSEQSAGKFIWASSLLQYLLIERLLVIPYRCTLLHVPQNTMKLLPAKSLRMETR